MLVMQDMNTKEIIKVRIKSLVVNYFVLPQYQK